jgi:integrase
VSCPSSPTAVPAVRSTEKCALLKQILQAADYAKRWVDRELNKRARAYHDNVMKFLAGVTVPPGVPFTEKPFHLIIRADVTTAIDAKRTPSTQTFTKGEKTWTRKVGGEVAGNRLRDHLCGLWNWAIGEGYADVTPFARIGGGRSPIKKKPEEHRNRRLQDGEEASLLKADGHLHDCIVAALETGMRKDEILSLQWKHVRWLQSELAIEWRNTKTKKARQIPISPKLREVLVRRQKARVATFPESPKPKADDIADLYAFGNEIGGRIKNVKTAWETAVLKAHGVKVERTRGKLSAENRAKLAEIDLNFHDLRHQAGSRKLEGGWPLHAVSAWLGHTKLETTAKYLNVTTQYLHELNERKPLTLVRA